MESYKQQRERTLDSTPGFLIRAPGAPHRTTVPDWDKETRFRVFPAPKPDGGWFPIRASMEENDFGPAVWSEPVVRWLGVKKQLTYITRIPGEPIESPTEYFCASLRSLIEERPQDVPEDWRTWMKGAKKQPAKLRGPVSCIFFQGASVMESSKLLVNTEGQSAPRYPSLFMGSVSVLVNFERLANTGVEGYTGPAPSQVQGTDDAARMQLDAIYAAAFQSGDWCSLERGRVMSVYQAPPDPNEKAHYTVEMKDVLDLTQIADRVRACWWPWKKLLRYFSAVEQIKLLCDAFPAEALDYVFGRDEKYAGYLPENIVGTWARFRGARRARAVAGYDTREARIGPSLFDRQTQPVAGVQPKQPLPGPSGVDLSGGAPLPAQAPAAEAGQVVSGGFDLSGGGRVPPDASERPIVPSGALAEMPAELTGPPSAMAPQPQLPASVAQSEAGQQNASGVVTGDVNEVKLQKALDDLRRIREQASRGDLGSQE